MLINNDKSPLEKRSLDPIIIHGIWSGVINISIKKNGDTNSCDYDQALVDRKCLVDFLKTFSSSHKDLKNIGDDDTKVLKSIEQAINEGLIRKQLKSSNSTSADETKTLLTNGTISNDVNDNDDYDVCLISLPTETVSHPSHDWYCFECHRVHFNIEDEESIQSSSSLLLKCQHCWRVYHQKCVQFASEFTNHILSDDSDKTNSVEISHETSTSFICPICTLIRKYAPYSVGSRHFDHNEFNEILSYTYTRFKAKASQQILHSIFNLKQSYPSLLHENVTSPSFLSSLTSSKIIISSSNQSQEMNGNSDPTNKKLIQSPKDLMTQLAIYYLSYKHVELVDIETRLERCEYKSIGEFFGDCLNLRHMLEIVVSVGAEQTPTGQRKIRDALLRMLEATRYELKEMVGCVDCYRNSNQQEDKLWFCWPCDPPHELVFAKQKGYPYWPAKVIYPRKKDEIEACNQLDVRFFGSNHERSLIDKSNIKHINSSLSELNIMKTIPSLDKALSELRKYRELLEGKKEKQNIQTKNANRNRNKMEENDINNTDNEKCNSTNCKSEEIEKNTKTNQSKSKTQNAEDNEYLEDFMTEDSSEDGEQTEEEEDDDDDDDDDEHETKTDEDDVTDIDSSVINSELENSREKTVHKYKSSPSKRGRGRPPKSKSTTKAKSNCEKSPLSNNRVRRKKVMYLPNISSRTQDDSLFVKTNTSPASSSLIKSKRGRMPKKFVHTSVLSSSKSVEKKSRSQKYQRLLSPSKRRNELRISTITTSTKEKLQLLSPINSHSPKSSRLLKQSYQYQKKKKEIERERQLIKARRKLLMNEIETPKHIPPVVATKSIPTQSVTPSKTILNQALTTNNKPTVINSVNSAHSLPHHHHYHHHHHHHHHQPINGYTYYDNQQQCRYEYLTVQDGYLIKSEMDASITNIDNDNNATTVQPNIKLHSNSLELEIITTTSTTEEYKPPSSILKPLNSEGETDEDRGADDECTNGQNNNDVEKNRSPKDQNYNHEQNVSGVSLNNSSMFVDDDDEEPYLYDDEQLEDHINYYLEYQKEKELENQQKQRLNYYYQQQTQQQQQLLHAYPQQIHQLPAKVMTNHQNTQMVDKSKLEKSSIKTNGFSNEVSLPEPITKYIDFSQAQVYVPTKKNQNLVNAYLHHVNTNSNRIPQYKNDYLAHYILKRDELEQDESSLSPRKRGRPPKGTESSFEHSGKAKCLLEKSYLQDSACNRACLTNNVKAFKKFREFLETQSKNEISRLKRELEESKQQVYRLTNKTTELEDIIKNERDLNKRYNPVVVSQMEERYKREISEVKRKQWCISCEAEANYFCCFKTNYCSPECQLKHWQSGHQFDCTRNKTNRLSKSKSD